MGRGPVLTNNDNKPDGRRGQTQYRGTFWAKDRGVWRAQIWREGKSQCVGYYITAFEAARAYDEAVIRFMDRDTINTSVAEIVKYLERGESHIKNKSLRDRLQW